MPRLKFCIILDTTILKQHHGVRRYLLSLAAAVREDIDVDIFCVSRLDDGQPLFSKVYVDANYERNNGFSECRLVGTGRKQLIRELDVICRPNAVGKPGQPHSIFLGSELTGEYDIVLLGAPWVYRPGLKLPKARRNYCLALDAIPILYSRDQPDNASLKAFAEQHMVGFRHFTENLDGLLAISEETVKQCVGVLGGHEDVIHAIPMFFPAGFDKVATEPSPAKTSKRVVLAAPFDMRKGLADMPRILNESGATSLAIFGGVRCAQEHIDTFFIELAIDDVEWWSEVDFAKQMELYSRASALLFPSKSEGLGLPVLEAYCCGTAAFVTDIPPINYLVVAGGVLPAQSPGQTLGRYLESPTSPQQFKDHALKAWGREHVVRFLSDRVRG